MFWSATHSISCFPAIHNNLLGASAADLVEGVESIEDLRYVSHGAEEWVKDESIFHGLSSTLTLKWRCACAASPIVMTRPLV
jgi:hypothetical protein